MNLRSIISDKISANYDDVDLFCIKAEKEVRKNKLDEENFGLQLMLREGLINAVKHGCNNNNNLTIDCSLLINDKEYIIIIEDPGSGFNWRIPRQESDLEDTSGRGLSIIHKYSSSFFFNKKGNKLTIRKYLNNGDNNG